MDGSRDIMLLNTDGILPITEILHPARDLIVPNGIARPIHRKAKHSHRKERANEAARKLWRCGCLFFTIISISLGASIFVLIHTGHIVLFFQEQIKEAGECSESCSELKTKGYNKSGVFLLCGIRCDSYAYCDQVTDGGGWLVIQRRKFGDENFDKTWDEYKDGFGDVDGDFWYGNKRVLKIANNTTRKQLRFDMCDNQENCVHATYSEFYLGGPDTKYSLNFQDYDGTAGDSLSKNRNMKFSTYDQDNDAVDSHCSQFRGGGGWWYNRCGNSNPNGIFNDNEYAVGINWKSFKGNEYSLPFMEIKIR